MSGAGAVSALHVKVTVSGLGFKVKVLLHGPELSLSGVTASSLHVDARAAFPGTLNVIVEAST